MNRPPIGATSLGFGSAPLEEVFAGLAAVGAECCELNGRPGQHGGETLTADRVLPLAVAHGVRVTSVGGYCDFADPDTDAQVERLLVACRLAADLGVDIVRAMVADAAPGVTLDGIRERVVAGFAAASEQAGRLGVRLGIENHGRVANDGRWLAGIVDEVDATTLGFTLDTGNFAWAGRPPSVVAADIAAVLPRVISVHVKDVAWDGESFAGFVPAGDGGIDLPGILGALAARGYDGPIVSEYEGPGSHTDGTARSITHLLELAQGCLWVSHPREEP